ncbi:cytochrome c [Devosia sp. MC532]|uniref:c-type cytochrome n=1 Tax=unclassified Devosia TaxID=196773 RepID=UPI0018F441C2|nr:MULTISPECIES: cytochrome c [unclassified Devosia]MBJ7579311.1 cytochrome c [Devosia sp. MC532]MBK1796161.1 cytochrome c [Devosia sp. WQ 349K1]
MNMFKVLAAVALLGSASSASLAQESGVGTAPNFIPLQDHLTMTDGEQIYKYHCWNCHGEGPGKPGTTALAALHGDSLPAVLEERTDLDPEYIRYLVRNGVSIMPHFRQTHISDTQLEALVDYLTRNNLQ